MANKSGWSFNIDANIEVQQGKLDKASKILDSFYNKYRYRTVQIDTDDMIDAAKHGIAVIKDLYEDGTRDATSWLNIRPAMRTEMEGMLADAENVFSDIKVLFNNGDYVSGIADILHGFERQLSVVFTDIGGYYDELIQKEKELNSYYGKPNSVPQHASEAEIEERIRVLDELIDTQQKLKSINPSLTAKDFLSGFDEKKLQNFAFQLREALETMREYELSSFGEFNSRKRILNDIQSLDTWDGTDQFSFKNEKEYDGAIRTLSDYISKRQELIKKLRENESDLFSVDGIEQHVSTLSSQIARYEEYLSEMIKLKGDSATTSDDGTGNLPGVVSQLGFIKDAIVEIKDAFKPLTDALANEDSVLSAMVKSNIADLELLQSKVQEVFANVLKANNNEGNVNNDITDSQNNQYEEFLNKVKNVAEQTKAEFDIVRSKIEEVFNFSTINPNIENITSITNEIYKRFEELQVKIGNLEFKLQPPKVIDGQKSESDVIKDASEAMKDEGDAASDAVPKKNAFTEANEKAATSADKTKESTEGAAEGIKEESKAAKEAVENLKNANTKIQNQTESVRLTGLTQKDFENYASNIAKDQGLTMGQVSVVMGSDDKMRIATVQMLNEELAQSVTYTYQLLELEEGVVEAYLTGYRAVGNTNKALRIAAAAQKKADAERLKRDKAQAKNDEWLIKQQTKLDTQERRYKHSKKSIDGNTPLMSTETSLEGVVDGANKTIDALAKHIRDRIQNTIGDTLTDDLRQQILDDLRILQNEIAVEQNNKYSATNMKASNVETNKLAYTEYLNAFEANAKKANVFEIMKDDISDLRKELKNVTDSTGLDKFIDNLKVARNKLTAEKAKYAQESQASKQNEEIYENAIKSQEKLYNLKKQMVGLDPESSKGQETMRKLTDAQNEYNEALSKTNRQLLTIGQLQEIEDLEKQQKKELNLKQQEYKSGISTEQEAKDLKYVLSLYEQYTDATEALKKMQTDPTGAAHDKKTAAALEAMRKAKEALLALGIDVKNISASELLTENQINALLEKQIEHRKKIRDIENAAQDKTTTKQNKQNQNYGKSIFNRESRYNGIINANISSLGDTAFSDDFLSQVEKYKIAYKELEDLRNKFENDPKAADDSGLKNKFQESALSVEKLRKELMNTFKEYEKFSNIPQDSIIAKDVIDTDKFSDAKSAMIDFANSTIDGKFKIEGFNSAGTEMSIVVDKGNGVLQEAKVRLNSVTNEMVAFTTGSKKATTSWSKFGSEIQSKFKQMVGMYFGLNDIIRVFRNGVKYVKEIDLAMTELKKVTDETDEAYNRFLKNASKISAVIGSTVSDFTDATAAFARLGYTIDEASSMAETAIVYKNVADGLDTVEEATDSIISTMMAFGIEANDTMSIIDKFNAVGKIYADYKVA